jgi:hypothetical protein
MTWRYYLFRVLYYTIFFIAGMATSSGQPSVKLDSLDHTMGSHSSERTPIDPGTEYGLPVLPLY